MELYWPEIDKTIISVGKFESGETEMQKSVFGFPNIDVGLTLV